MQEHDLTHKLLSSGDSTLIKEVLKKNLTYLPGQSLNELINAIKEIQAESIDGRFIEAGCALGGSAIVIGKLKSQERQFDVYDTFSMIPPPSDRDGKDVHERYSEIKEGKSKGLGDSQYYGYVRNLKKRVKKTFKEFDISIKAQNISLIEGLFEDTLRVSEPVALAHLDCDWYDSVMFCLQQIEPNLSLGGFIVLDDYYHWSGTTEAANDFFEDKLDNFIFSSRAGRLYIKRIK